MSEQNYSETIAKLDKQQALINKDLKYVKKEVGEVKVTVNNVSEKIDQIKDTIPAVVKEILENYALKEDCIANKLDIETLALEVKENTEFRTKIIIVASVLAATITFVLNFFEDIIRNWIIK